MRTRLIVYVSMNEINYDDIKNDLADLGFSDDAGELTERAEASFWSQVDVNQSEQDYFISLDYPYTEEIPQPLTGNPYEENKPSGEFYPFVLLAIPSKIPLRFDYTEDPDRFSDYHYHDGRCVEVRVSPKGYSEDVVEKWVEERVAAFESEYGYKPFLQERYF